jgi:hypothetical protein
VRDSLGSDRQCLLSSPLFVPEITIRLQPRFTNPDEVPGLTVIRLDVGPDFGLDMLPYPTALRLCLTRQAARDLLDKVPSVSRQGPRLKLTDLRITGQAVPDLDVVHSLAPGRLQVDGFLGFDFFEKFDVVEWRPKTRLLRLVSG